jgi:hypothetical protein
MVPVDLRKGPGGEGYYPYLALVNLGATYNFITQSVMDKLRFEAVWARRSKVKKKAPPSITRVNSELLRATTVVQQTVQIRDSVKTKQGHVINFIVTDIAHYNMILSMAWLQKQNPDIHWDTRVWH